MTEGPRNLWVMRLKEKDNHNNELVAMPSSTKSFCINSYMPSMFISNIADLEERMRILPMVTGGNDGQSGDTFAERAESYYHKRPQLLELLQDLYNSYVMLSDRYLQTLAKQNQLHHQRDSSQVSTTDHDYSDQDEASGVSQVDSDMESSISSQQPYLMLPLPNDTIILDRDAAVAELVMKNIEFDLLLHEVSVIERFSDESSRKIELQKNLLEVLESERLILLNENARLGYKVNALMDENKGLTSESMFMKRKAEELARCVLKMREDQRVYLLNKKIEDLQGQICGLEKGNKEYYEQLIMKDNNHAEKMKSKDNDRSACEACSINMVKLSQRFKRRGNSVARKKDEKKECSWWKRMKNVALFSCGGMNPSCAKLDI